MAKKEVAPGLQDIVKMICDLFFHILIKVNQHVPAK
jgi:hypothetical protein